MESQPCPTCDLVKTTLEHLLDSLKLFLVSNSGLIASNDVPSDAKIDEIKRKLPAMRQAMDSLGTGIKTIYSMLKELEHGRDKAGWRIKRVESIISPVRRLPFEIIANIFHYAAQPTNANNNNSDKCDSLAPNQFPFNVFSVSTFWRNVAVAQPRLWTHLKLEISSKSTTHISPSARNARIAALRRWLEIIDGQRYPFHVHIVAARNVPKATFIDNSDLLSLLCSSSEHWRSAHFECPPHFFPCIAAIKGRLGRLTSLNLNVLQYTGSGLVWPYDLDIFSISPNLQCVELQGHFISGRELLPWNQITRLTSHVGFDRDILEWVPTLQELTLDSPSQSYGSNLTTEYKLPDLHTLKLCNSQWSISYLTLPSLSNLSLLYTTPSDFDQLVRNLSHCPWAKSVRNLTLELDLRLPIPLEPLLRALPAIQHLTLTDQPGNITSHIAASGSIESTLTLLTLALAHPSPSHQPRILLSDSNSTVLAPRLNSLELILQRPYDISCLDDIVTARWEYEHHHRDSDQINPTTVTSTSTLAVSAVTPVRIESLKLVSHLNLDLDKQPAWERLQVFQQEGLALSYAHSAALY